MKRFVIILIGILFALCASEYRFRNVLQIEKDLGEYSQSVTGLIDEFDEKLTGEVTAGKFNRYFWLSSVSADTLKKIQNTAGAVRGVTLIDKNFHTFAATNGNFSSEEAREQLIQLQKNGTSKLILLPQGLFGVYKVQGYYDEPIGYIVFEASISGFSPDTVTFMVPPSRNFVRINETEKLSQEHVKAFTGALYNSSLAGGSHGSVDLWKKYNFAWTSMGVDDYYIGILRPAPPIYSYYSLYGFCISVLLLGFVYFKEKSETMSNSEVIRMILDKNRESLSSLKSNMNKIEDALKPQEWKPEKKVEGTVITGTYAAETRKANIIEERDIDFYEKPAMEFILFDPMEEEWLQPSPITIDVKEIEKADELRQKAFSNELMSLMSEIGDPKRKKLRDEKLKEKHTGEPVESKPEEGARAESQTEAVKEAAQTRLEGEIAAFEELFARSKFDEYGQILKRLYEAENPVEEFEAALHYIKKSMNADGLCLMFFDTEVGCYTYTTGAGIDENWGAQLYLLHNDPYVKISKVNVCDTDVSPELRETHFFTKRFPEKETHNIEGLRTVPLHPFELNAILLAIYTTNGKPGWKDRAGEFTREQGDVLVHGIVPAIRRMFLRDSQFHARYQFKELLRELKAIILQADKSVHVLHVETAKPWTSDEMRYINNQSPQLITFKEKMVISTPDHIVFILSDTEPSSIKSFFSNIKADTEFRDYTYPDYGKSLFVYV